MSNSLRDQLLQSGLVKQLREEKQARTAAKPLAPRTADAAHQERGRNSKQVSRRAAKPADDLAQAYAARARLEREERQAEQRRQEEAARLKRERKQRMDALIQSHSANLPDADQPRYFEHRSKIRRIFCSEAQLKAVNAGELAVAVHQGRYHLIAAPAAKELSEFWPEALVVMVDPNSPHPSDEYADPRYRVPDDLVW